MPPCMLGTNKPEQREQWRWEIESRPTSNRVRTSFKWCWKALASMRPSWRSTAGAKAKSRLARSLRASQRAGSAAQDPVCILVRATLPWTVRVSKEDLHSRLDGKAGVIPTTPRFQVNDRHSCMGRPVTAFFSALAPCFGRRGTRYAQYSPSAQATTSSA